MMAVMLAVFVGGWMTRNRVVMGALTLSTVSGSTLLGANNIIIFH